MNQDWSNINKLMQAQLSKVETFEAGIKTLLGLRCSLFTSMLNLKKELPDDAFSKMPFKNASGNHSTSLAWSLWHVFRIEDIVSHDLIAKDKEVFFDKGYGKLIGSKIITTGNELTKAEIKEFSKTLNISRLFDYCIDVKNSTETILRQLKFPDLKTGFSEEDKAHLKALHVVSDHEDAAWLIDYWCGKNTKGLIQMPFSRHWMMHTEAMLKIFNKILR